MPLIEVIELKQPSKLLDTSTAVDGEATGAALSRALEDWEDEE